MSPEIRHAQARRLAAVFPLPGLVSRGKYLSSCRGYFIDVVSEGVSVRSEGPFISFIIRTDKLQRCSCSAELPVSYRATKKAMKTVNLSKSSEEKRGK